jgi:maleate isomerase
MKTLDYQLTGPIGERATLGLVALQSDESVEPELQSVFRQDGVALYTTRIESDAEVTPETLKTMEVKLPNSVALLPPSLDFDVIGYACTSGATIIGPDRISELIYSASNAKQATNPLTALIDTCQTHNVKSLGFISPYIDSVSLPMRRYLHEKAGIEIADFASFNESTEAKVARIDPKSILDAAIEIGSSCDCDAVFLSCTNLRTFSILDAASAKLNKPVWSSNSVLARHMSKLAGLNL